MSANPIRRKTHWLLAGLLLFHLVLMSISAKHPYNEQSIFRTWMLTVFSPIVRVGDSVLSAIGGSFTGLSELRRAKTENQDLKQQVEQLTIELNETREKAKELEVIRNT